MKTQQWSQDWKRSISIPIPKKGHTKECILHLFPMLVKWSEVAQSCPTLCEPMDCSLRGSSVHGIFKARYWSGLSFPSPGTRHANKVMLKFVQASVQHYVNWELLDVQAGFRKGRRTREQQSLDHRKSKEISGKKVSTSASLTRLKHLTVWITTNCGKFFMRWKYQTTLPASWEICIQIKKQPLEPDMEQLSGCKSGKEYFKAVYRHSAYLTYMQSTHVKCWAGWSKSWNQDCQEKYQYPQIGKWHHPYGRKQRGTKERLDKGESGEWKSWLKSQHSENEDHGIQSHHFLANRWGNNANSDRFYFLGLQNHCGQWLQPWN